MEDHPQINFNSEEVELTKDEASKLAKELKRQLRNGLRPKSDQKSIQLMVAGLGDSRGLLRRTFSEGLGVVGKAALPALRFALLNNPNVIVRRAAAKTLKLVGDPVAVPDLLHALINDLDPVVQASAAAAMAIFGEESVELLSTVLINEQSTAMQSGLARWGMAFIGRKAPEAIRKAAKSKRIEIRAAAIAALGDQIQSLDDVEARKLVFNALNDPSADVRAEATTLLGRFDDPELTSPPLCNKLNDSDPVVRRNAALSLMKSKSLKAITALKERALIEQESDASKVINLAIRHLSNLNDN